MSRSFDPTAGADSITFSPGAAPADQGPITVAVLAKAASTSGWTGWMISGRTAGAVWGLLTSNNAGAKLFAENDFGSGVAGLSTSWRWYVMTKASGSAIPRFHVWDLSTAWAHTNNTATVGDGTGPITTLIVGSNGANGWRGSIACIAVWDSVLTDTQIEATMTLKASDVLAGAPKWMIRLNQSSIATAVSDDTAGGGNQTAISGTTVDSDDPPGFSYSLAPTVTPNGLAIPVTFGQPTVGMPVSPNGLAIPVTFGQPTVSGQPYVAPLTTGSWWELNSILDATRTQIQWWNKRQPVACPNDGEPMRRSVDGILYCPFDNWQPDGQTPVAVRRANAKDWGGLVGIKRTAAADTVANQLLLACPNDGEPLSIDRFGQQYCKYDGWMPDPMDD